MTPRFALRTVYRSLLSTYRATFTAGHHEVAFHALSAAAHAAEDLGDAEALVEIERLALEHLAWIDANDPDHRFSSSSSSERHHRSIFVQLGTTASMMRARIEMRASRSGSPPL